MERLDETVLTTIAASSHRPLLFAHATIRTLDPIIGELPDADLLVGGAVVVGVGPGLHTAAEDDDMIVVDCTGLTIVPAVLDGVAAAGLRPHPATLAPGAPATFLVVTDDAVDPGRTAAIIVDGRITAINGRRLVPAPDEVASTLPDPKDSPYLGMWIDETGFLHQELTADGRYDETRGGRPHAYQGSFWIDGTRITYRDDLGFWAFGDFTGDTLHHAGYTLHRR
ncbi:Atu4866 domain-containing protein [Catenuloplanes sp. NPDC051500]|uniref:Atu4866 domain-containing protein n=1 Tax=Catenuloplanes sp. NPDC051500 TaxID=3363959 RepID=UPI0037A7E686